MLLALSLNGGEASSDIESEHAGLLVLLNLLFDVLAACFVGGDVSAYVSRTVEG